MPVPPNQTPSTATDLGAFPFSITQDVSGATGPTYTVWYKFTAAFTYYVGIHAHAPIAGVYQPELTVWTGPVMSLVQYPTDNPIDAFNQDAQFPVTNAITYYLKVVQSNVGVPDNLLTVAGLKAPDV